MFVSGSEFRILLALGPSPALPRIQSAALARQRPALYTRWVKKLLLIALAVMLVFALVVGGSAYLYFTPHLAFRELERTARRGDAVALAQQVDFPALRVSLKGQVQARIDQQAAQNPNPLAAFGSALAGAFSAPAVDAMVTPENVARMLRGENVAGVQMRLETNSVELHYASRDRFEATTAPAPNGFTLVLARDGWFDWKLVDVVLPANWVFPAQTPV